MAMVYSKSVKWRILACHAFLIGFLCITLFPLLMVIAISFREGNLAVGSIFPEKATLEHWYLAFGVPFERADGEIIQPPFPVFLWLWNSVKVATISSFMILLLSTTSAYAFARMRFRYKQLTLNAMLVAQMFPATLALVAIYVIFDKFGTYVPWLGVDSHWSVILASLGGITLHIWTIKGFFEMLDPSIEEAAIVDGATVWQAFVRILLPMSLPILSVVFILAFITNITEYPVASVLLQTEDNLTLAVGSRLYLYEQNYLWGDFAAAVILSGLPITCVFLIAQKWLISGLSEGGIKG